MDVIPSIDLRGGKCVNLYQGDYARETVYSENPIDAATHWVGLGATRLHVVDLDGARSGAQVNLTVVKDMVSSVSAPVQLGGGIRTVETARDMMSLGIDRVVVGTAAIESPDLVQSLCEELGPDVVVVGVDARDGYVAVRGWTESSGVQALDLIMRMEGMGVRQFMYTDIARDGTLTEPNFSAIEDLAERTEARLMVAGGISAVPHIRRLVELGVDAAIVGKALYTGDIDFPQALEAARQHGESISES